MKNSHIIIAILSFLPFVFFDTSAMEGVPQSIRYWAPSHLTEEQIAELEAEITIEKNCAIEKNEIDKNREFGFSFAGINPAQVECLYEINNRYEQNGIRPKCADFGAGHGYMTWKMVAAGGDVFALEPQDPTRGVLRKNVKKAVPFLKEGEDIAKVSRSNGKSTSGNVLAFDTCPAYREEYRGYEVTWSGNLEHIFTPDEARAYTKNLFEITNEGGYAFATVHTAACASREILAHFFHRKQSGLEDYGYFITNNTSHCRQYTRRSVVERTSFTPVSNMGPIDKNLSPTTIKEGFYEGGAKQESWRTKRYTDNNGESYFEYVNKNHSVKHFFDTDSLKALFEGAGFIVDEGDVFLMNLETSMRLEGPISLEMMTSDRMSIYVGIKARKPGVSITRI